MKCECGGELKTKKEKEFGEYGQDGIKRYCTKCDNWEWVSQSLLDYIDYGIKIGIL